MSADLAAAGAIAVTDDSLRRWPLPMPDQDGDKEERGRVLIIAGSREMPGAAILAATAALRAGAGKLTVATAASVAPLVAAARPEGRVIELPETPAGGIAPAGAEKLLPLLGRCNAVLIGPGMQDEHATCALVLALLPRLGGLPLVLDAGGMNVVRRQLQAVDTNGSSQQRYVASFNSPVLLTPHAGEMAHLSAMDKESVQNDPVGAARGAARRWNAAVALKGATTYIATPEGRIWEHDRGNVGLATSGSGDTLAGIIAGLAARGAPLEQAAVWGVALHARAGERLAQRYGPLGYLAGELPAEIPALMHRLSC